MKVYLDTKLEVFPPSKNALYYGTALKKAFINRIMDFEDIKKFRELISKIPYKEFYVMIEFYLTSDKYKRFEPQNYIDVLSDALFGEYRDHYVKALCVAKKKSNSNFIHIVVKSDE